VGFVKDDHAVKVLAEPVEDLAHPRLLALAAFAAQRRVGREQDALGEADQRPQPEPGERRDQQPLLPQRRPIALGVIEQLVRLRHPDGAAAPLEPIVEDDAGDLAALAGAGAVAEEPAAPEAHGVLGLVGRSADDIESLVHRPRSGEETRMGLAGINDAFELGLGQLPLRQYGGWQMRTVARLGRRDRGHCRRLHQPGWMRSRARDADRLQRVSLVERLGEATALGLSPIARLVGELDGFDRRGDGCRWAGRNGTRTRRHRAHRRARQDRREARRRRFCSRRNLRDDPIQQGRGVGCYSWRCREHRRVGGRHAVDHRQAGRDRRAVAGIDGAVDRGREQDAAPLLQTDKAFAPCGGVRAEVRAGDGDEASAVGKARQRRRDVPERGVGDTALDVNRRRERRVHQHDGRTHAAVEVIVNMRGVEAADRHCWEQRFEQSAAGLGEFVQRQPCPGEFGEDRQQAGPCRGLPRRGPQRKRWVSWEGLRERGMGWTRPRALFTRQVSPRSRQPSSSQLRETAPAPAGAEAGKFRLGCFRDRRPASPMPARRVGGGLFRLRMSAIRAPRAARRPGNVRRMGKSPAAERQEWVSAAVRQGRDRRYRIDFCPFRPRVTLHCLVAASGTRPIVVIRHSAETPELTHFPYSRGSVWITSASADPMIRDGFPRSDARR